VILASGWDIDSVGRLPERLRALRGLMAVLAADAERQAASLDHDYDGRLSSEQLRSLFVDGYAVYLCECVGDALEAGVERYLRSRVPS
jgi:hypothetical protein